MDNTYTYWLKTSINESKYRTFFNLEQKGRSYLDSPLHYICSSCVCHEQNKLSTPWLLLEVLDCVALSDFVCGGADSSDILISSGGLPLLVYHASALAKSFVKSLLVYPVAFSTCLLHIWFSSIFHKEFHHRVCPV